MQTFQFDSVRAMRGITDAAPWLSITGMLFAFVVLFIVKGNYEAEILVENLPELGTALGFLIATVIITLRIATGATSALMFREGNFLLGTISLLVSLAVTVYEYQDAANIAAHWSRGNELYQNSLSLVIRLCAVISFVMEFILALTLTLPQYDNDGGDDAKKEPQEQAQAPDKEQAQAPSPTLQNFMQEVRQELTALKTERQSADKIIMEREKSFLNGNGVKP